MRNFRQTLSAILVLVTVSLVNGWHLPVLQGVAWMNMFQEYNEVMPADKALKFTFSGEELCDLCQFVKTEHNSAQQELNQWSNSRIQLIVYSQKTNRVPVSENNVKGNTEYVFKFTKYSAPPGRPPPRQLLV